MILIIFFFLFYLKVLYIFIIFAFNNLRLYTFIIEGKVYIHGKHYVNFANRFLQNKFTKKLTAMTCSSKNVKAWELDIYN